MMTPRRLAGLAVGGAVALAGLRVAGLGPFTTPHVDIPAASVAARIDTDSPTPPAAAIATAAAPAIAIASADANLSGAIVAGASAAAPPAAEPPAAEPIVTNPGPAQPPTRGMQLASVPTSGAVEDELKQSAIPSAPAGECVTDVCIDAYLWSLYERASKIDTEKVPEQQKVTVKKKGKIRTVMRTVIKYVVADFTWKDPAAAQRAGMNVKDYVIGGMDPDFKRKLAHALHMMDDAGFMPGITSAFRDDYRQSIATGNKASNDRSYHGGSLRGGYGHGLAADLVSVKGDNRAERFAASEQLWAWIDAHEKELGIGRPYLDRDPPHVAAIDGTEYIVKRSLVHLHKRAARTKKAEKPRPKATKQLSWAPDPARQGMVSRENRSA
jgi:hypothetical protein